jgi:hypothetical protein
MAVHQCCKSSTPASLGRCRNTEDADPAARESLSGFSARRCFGKPRLRLRGYSPLKAITRDNVRHLRSAWAWSLPNGPNEATPLVHDGVLFVHAYGDKVQALDAATGSGPAPAPRTALSRPHAGANHAGSERWPKVSSSPVVSSRAGRATGSTIRRQRQLVDLCRHDEIVLVQSLDLLGAQRRIAPAETYVRVMAFGFCDLSDLLHERQGLPEVSKPESSLDPRGPSGDRNPPEALHLLSGAEPVAAGGLAFFLGSRECPQFEPWNARKTAILMFATNGSNYRRLT